MFENTDVQIGEVNRPITTRRTEAWKYSPSSTTMYAGEKARYTIMYIWEGSYYHHAPSGACMFIPVHSLVLTRRGNAPFYNTSDALPCCVTNISFYTEEPIPMELPDNVRVLFKPESSWEVEKHMSRILQLEVDRPFGWKMEMRNIISHLLICMMKQYFEGQKQTYIPALLTESINLIRRNIFRTSLSVTDAAQLCHVTPTYLIRLFRRHLNTTPKKYMDELRVERACELLKYSDKSVEEIAVESGFSEARQMRRVFHEHMGVSPKEYRGQI
ncbi:MAG: helix-turn-helix domain-containing protein [Ruminococcaceae bacterium]|nr:helix-turn-helix domain-containing protein [Oscillospiraceae bacterium]